MRIICLCKIRCLNKLTFKIFEACVIQQRANAIQDYDLSSQYSVDYIVGVYGLGPLGIKSNKFYLINVNPPPVPNGVQNYPRSPNFVYHGDDCYKKNSS